GLRLPNQMEELVEEVYGPRPPEAPNRAWAVALSESEQELKLRDKTWNKRAKGVAVQGPFDEDDILETFCLQLEEDNPETHPTLHAATRLTEPNVTLVLLHQRAGGLFLEADGTGPVRLDLRPGLAEAKRLLANTV